VDNSEGGGGGRGKQRTVTSRWRVYDSGKRIVWPSVGGRVLG
jgi:hypothetical protein